MGVVMGELVDNGITVAVVSEGGPAARAGVQAQDVITGYDGQPWQRVPNMITALQGFAPGETITLMIQRGEEALEIPVVLEPHPTRRVMPEALWLRHEADLSAFAGQEVLLRFETVTLPGYETEGFALDNIEVLEVNFGDGGDQGDAWTLEGFVQTTNAVPQAFIVQTALLGPQQDSPIVVQQWLAPGDPATRGEWRLALTPGQLLLIAVSPVSDDTAQAAAFDLSIDVDAE
jgi:membrane-associated protease RseP (regulator of RpoE activity)